MFLFPHYFLLNLLLHLPHLDDDPFFVNSHGNSIRLTWFIKTFFQENFKLKMTTGRLRMAHHVCNMIYLNILYVILIYLFTPYIVSWQSGKVLRTGKYQKLYGSMCLISVVIVKGRWRSFTAQKIGLEMLTKLLRLSTYAQDGEKKHFFFLHPLQCLLLHPLQCLTPQLR